jgi:hypothetical protein
MTRCRRGVGEQDAGTLALASVARDHVPADDVVEHARDRRLRVAVRIDRERVVPGNGDPAVVLVPVTMLSSTRLLWVGPNSSVIRMPPVLPLS